MYSNFKKAITQIFNEYLHWVVEIRIILDDDWPGPASNGYAVVVTSLKTNPEDSRGGNGEDPEQAMLRTRLNLPVKFPQFFTGPRYQALGHDKIGDFGARDPYPIEIASEFGDKVLGFQNTEHKILIPTVSASSLAQQECTPVSPLQQEYLKRMLNSSSGRSGCFFLFCKMPNQVRAELWTSSIGGLTMNDFL